MSLNRKIFIISSLFIEQVIFIFNSLGINISSSKKNFRLREDDKTPSASIYIKNGKVRIHDFGVNFDGDIIDVLKKFFGLSFKDAIDYVVKVLGIEEDSTHFILKKKFNL